MASSLLDTYDEIAYAALLEERLAGASAALAERDDRVDERSWLDAARRRLETARLANGEVARARPRAARSSAACAA